MNFAPLSASEPSAVLPRTVFEPVVVLALRHVPRGLRARLEARWECWEANDVEGAEACLRAAEEDALLVLDPDLDPRGNALRLLGASQIRAAVLFAARVDEAIVSAAFRARVHVLPCSEEEALAAYLEERVASLAHRAMRPLERRRAAECGVAQRLAVTFGWTPSERDVVLGRLRGETVKRIAALRGSGHGTVKKQLALASRKARMDQRALLRRLRDEVELWMAAETLAA